MTDQEPPAHSPSARSQRSSRSASMRSVPPSPAASVSLDALPGRSERLSRASTMSVPAPLPLPPPSRAPSAAPSGASQQGAAPARRPPRPPTQQHAVTPQPSLPPAPTASGRSCHLPVAQRPAQHFDCSLEQPAFQAVLDWWESAATVLGVTAGVVTAADVEESLARASGASSQDGLRRRSRSNADGVARAGAGGGRAPAASPTDSAESFAARRGRMRSDAAPEAGGGGVAEERDGGGIPGLDFLYRLYAPRKLLDAYEALEREVESSAFKRYSPEEQKIVLNELQETQAAIERRENRLNTIAAAVGGFHGAYVGTMASMLAIFVPQQCPPTATDPTYHTCNLYENTHELSEFNKLVLACNAFTLVMMLLTEFSVFRRERWLDHTLSYNPRKPALNLSQQGPDGAPSLLQRHPYIAHQLLWQNLTAGNLARATIALVLVNLLLSAILILRFYPDGTRSYTALVTNTLLLGSKLLWAAVICLQSKNNQQGVSLYKTTRVNFNVLDANFLASEEYEDNKDRYSWEYVQAEYERVIAAEKGDVKHMAVNARKVLKHVALGRHTTKLGRRQNSTHSVASAAVAEAEEAEAAAQKAKKATSAEEQA